jgi:hypothetical protein
MRRLTTLIVAVSLAVPVLAEAQAIPKTTSSSSGSSSGSSGSSGGGSSSSSSSGGGGSEARVSPPAPSSGSERTYSRLPASGSSSSRSGGSTARPAPVPGGVASSDSSRATSRTGSDLTPPPLGSDLGFLRTRNGRPIAGTATARPTENFVSFPFYGPWGSYYPWYGGFGWNLGFVGYNPWHFGATRWFWSPYGLWYDPYTYYWDPFWSSGYSSSSYYREREEKEPETMGSLRIKANLGSAKVYIDNALVGLVDEFDGLKNHLEIEGGRHTLEIRADGYVTHTQDIDVKVGKTQTVRINLKQKK